jgi:2-polyprenyl-6-methoxyphenol hydroxylase-like FAD-dependent oxidoreductase
MSEGRNIDTHDTAVLIVGGGPVGLSLAIELARLGVSATLVEVRDGTIDAPKMNFVNVRSMEFIRRWDLTREVREAGHPPDFHPNVRWATAVTGFEIASLDLPPLHEQKTARVSPAYDCLVSQYWFDPILLADARTRASIALRHLTRLQSFRAIGSGIEAHLTDQTTGRDETLTAQFIVGCDGAGSTIRQQLGIGLTGLPEMQRNFHVFFRSTELIDIYERALGETRFLSLVGPGRVWGVLTSINWRGLWRFAMHPPPEDKAEVPDLIRKAVGAEFEFELLNEAHWSSPKLVADAFGRGRAFLAGDAAHQLNPSGGFGLNTGLGDAMDLAWKLAAVVDGWGGVSLLESYEVERRPIAVRNVEEATLNLRREQGFAPGDAIDQDSEEGAVHRAAFRQSLFDADVMRHHDTDGIALGYRYDGSPVICPDGTAPRTDEVRDYHPTTRPGHRAPHAWIDEGRSMLDLFGNGLTLLSFGGPADASVAFSRAAETRGVPLTVVPVSQPEIAELYERRLVLVRPDGHVAWRGDEAPGDAGAVIDVVRGAAVE